MLRWCTTQQRGSGTWPPLTWPSTCCIARQVISCFAHTCCWRAVLHFSLAGNQAKVCVTDVLMWLALC